MTARIHSFFTRQSATPLALHRFKSALSIGLIAGASLNNQTAYAAPTPESHISHKTIKILPFDQCITQVRVSLTLSPEKTIVTNSTGYCIDDPRSIAEVLLELSKQPNTDFHIVMTHPYVECSLPLYIRQNLMQFMKDHPDTTTWDCGNFVQAAYGMPTSLRNSSWVTDWKSIDPTSPRKPGDILWLFNSELPQKSSHFALYLCDDKKTKESLYISKLGSGGITIQSFSSLVTSYRGNSYAFLEPVTHTSSI